jgi:MoxR-like ATPase
MYNEGREPHNVEDSAIEPVLTAPELDRCREAVRSLRMRPELVSYIRELVAATRSSDDLLIGAGPRGGIHLLLAARAAAAFSGRDFATPDDIQAVALPTLRHRVVLQPEAEANELTADDAIRAVLRRVPVPR